MTPLEMANLYFQLSNESNFGEIKKLFDDSSTFRSGTGELFLGVDNIMPMQKTYHGQFTALEWTVNNVSEIKPGIIHFEFNFKGKAKTGEVIEYSGLEDVVIFNGKIQHIQVQRL
ncbi:hypothetical protein GZ77_23070 [Endozoicomonas montiporae]|uniref:SnoaL-like domain-containing protein n=2 Tax=Endozoicomonas montiporae TaxID=1027273 RepID=A0A081N0K8_9GAMM|nr:hypothetical protein [Endozoicomonas montiporae]AMO54445.1 hypothetical protein EZMO1_0179 [Endozoicomonas montiporae CL-33]KEQ11981.1 hypothetical protein GZ77_23070 [Endozoicomonas montiporae]